MSVTAQQGFFEFTGETDSSGKFLSAEWPYFVFGETTTTEEEALDAALALAPLTFKGLRRDKAKFVEQINEKDSKILVTYKGSSGEIDPDDGDAFSFDTTGGTQTITQSRATVKYPTAAADFGSAINYDGEQVNGVEIVQPVLNFTESKVFDKGEITTAFRRNLAEMTGTVNNATWRGYEAGTLLFRGVTGSGKTNLPCELTFYFSHSPNRKNFYIGTVNVVIKKGWDYIWVRYADSVDGTAKSLVRKPIAAYVETVYAYTNFADLKLGN